MALLLTSALFSLASCEDTNELGVDLPGTTPINTEFEEFPVTASTTRLDSLPTTQKDHFLVGQLQDGNTGGLLEARSFLEVAASTDSLPSQYASLNPKLDSVVILAGFDRVYGSTTAPMRLTLYDLQQPLDDFTTYNSTSTIPLGAAIASNVAVNLNRTVRDKINTLDSLQNLPARIPLSADPANPTTWARQLFAKLLSTSSVTLTDTDLRTVWKGIGLVANSSGTAVGFSRSVLSSVYVYYHLPITASVNKRKVYRILFGDPLQVASSPRYFSNIRYTLNTPGSPFNALQGNGRAQVASTASGDVVYSQDGTGLTTKLVIPGLDVLKARQAQGNLIINRAELIVPVKSYSTAQFSAPAQLYLYEANNDNNRILLYNNGLLQYDRLVQQEGYLVPTANLPQALSLVEANATTKYYRTLLTGYVQAYAKGQLPAPAPTALLLSPTRRRSGGELTLDRAAIDAPNIKLRVYYSKTTAR
ncbi:DUF4270 domain-containing protein [Hymenobacter sp. 15J16-1T3B]|uniref:DUF4270 family protein n=1 Tax=Hymenobacter sp. 15J16-1T3B TaxID=2886941 RepID=UPI001D1030A1|nr:DUF4270 family protein [Hymenobacter sp. 15J16-1T3B]MCC3156041.1 DUF4270 domain-containing protein [Hymenobacter sp. 15J16-1T3B]